MDTMSVLPEDTIINDLVNIVLYGWSLAVFTVLHKIADLLLLLHVIVIVTHFVIVIYILYILFSK